MSRPRGATDLASVLLRHPRLEALRARCHLLQKAVGGSAEPAPWHGEWRGGRRLLPEGQSQWGKLWVSLAQGLVATRPALMPGPEG